ncbi:hypothetical protein ACFL0M_13780 [Thermodesulfobacteriota bacterium]
MIELKSDRIEVTDDITEIHHLFCKNGWSDGLPIIPPTKERVLRLINGTKQKPDEVINLIPPRWAEATIEKIAVNSVMAGCLPEHIPVIIAAVTAITESKFNLYGIQATTHPCGPLLVINGPIRKRLEINCGYGAFGPGTLANAVIGRAIRLILMNIGGAIPGKMDKATLGQPGKYTYAIGENEEKSPWESLSVERGFGPDENTVTVMAAEGPHNATDHQSVSALGILTTIAGTLATQGSNNIRMQIGEPLVILGPEHAKTIAQEGLTKKNVKEILFQKGRIPKSAFSKEIHDAIELEKRGTPIFLKML